MGKPSLYSISLDDYGLTPLSSSVYMLESSGGYDVFIYADEYIGPPIKIANFSNEIDWKKFAEILKNLKEGFASADSINSMHVSGVSGLRAECLKYAWAYQDYDEEGYKDILDFLLCLEEKTIDFLEKNFDIASGGKDFDSFIALKDYLLEDKITDFLVAIKDIKISLDGISKLLDFGSIEKEEKQKIKNQNDEKLLAIYSVLIEEISSNYSAHRGSKWTPPSDQTLVRNYLKKYLLETGKMPVGEHRIEIDSQGKKYGPGVINFTGK